MVAQENVFSFRHHPSPAKINRPINSSDTKNMITVVITHSRSGRQKRVDKNGHSGQIVTEVSHSTLSTDRNLQLHLALLHHFKSLDS